MEVNPIAISDIDAYLLYDYEDKENVYCIGSVSKDRYIEVEEKNKENIMEAIKYLDGENTTDEIEEKLRGEKNIKIDIQKLCNILEAAELLENSDKDKVEKGEYELLSLRLFSINIFKLNKLFKIVARFMKPIIVVSTIMVIIALIFGRNILLSLFSINIFNVTSNYVTSMVVIMLVMAVSLMIHELAHGVVAYRFGLKPKELVISLYLYVSPIVYLKIPGLYTVKPRERIKIWSAGILSNLVLSSLGLIGYLLVDGIMASIMLICFYVNIVLIVSNLFPLLPLDGYFIISTIMKMPNLRKKSFITFKNIIVSKFQELRFGKNKKEKKTKSLMGVYLIYFILSAAMIAYIVGSQLINISINFTEGLKNSGSVLSALWDVKFYILILALFIFSKIRKIVKVKY